MIEPCCLAAEGTRQPGFASPDEVLMGFQPGALRELQGIAPVKAAAGREVDVFDAGPPGIPARAASASRLCT